MSSLQFWNSWSPVYRRLFFILASLATLSVVGFWMAYLFHPAPLLQWEYFQQLQTELVPIKTIEIGLLEFELFADNNLVFESLLGSALKPSPAAFIVLLLVVSITAIVLISIITTLSRYWFLIGTGLFILFLASFRFETLQLFGDASKLAPGIIIFLYGALAFYFQSFRKETTFLLRIVAFSALTIVVAAIIYFFSTIPIPFIQLSASIFAFALVLSLVFVFLIAHEIVASVVWIVGQRHRKAKSLRQFTILALVYLANLLLIYLQKTGYLNWGIYTINLFFLLTVSTVLALWGFRHREEQYNKIFSADPFGVYLILSLSSIAFVTIGFLFLTANDPAITLVSNMILFSHLGYGIIFFLYVISNFSPMLLQNLAVHRVLYKPKTMPYFTFRIMGLIASYVFLAYDTTWESCIDQGFASYYNSRGDVYYLQGDETSAIGYFKRATFYRQTNHHGHYALATIYAAQVDPYNERLEYAKALEYAPSPYACINLSDTYERGQDYSKSVYVLELGLKKFPDNGPIANALGMVHARLQKPDSALYYFELAKQNGLTDVASTNLLAQSIRMKTNFPADSLFMWVGSDSEGTKSNALALANAQQKTIDIAVDHTLRDTILTAYSASLISNYIINHRTTIDTTFLHRAYDIASLPSNEILAETVQFAVAQAWYTQGFVNKAFRVVRQLAYLMGSGKYQQTLGLWSLEQNNPLMAYDYFDKAHQRFWPNAEYSHAVALTEADSSQQAIEAWQRIYDRGDSINKKIAIGMLQLLKATVREVINYSDADKYRYCRYTLGMFDVPSFEIIVNSMKSDEWKARTLYDMSYQWFQIDELEIATDLLAQAQQLSVTSEKLINDIKLLNWMMSVRMNQVKDIPMPMLDENSIEKVYLDAQQALQRNDLEGAQEKYEELLRKNIQFDEGVVAAIRFLSLNNKVNTKYHQHLTDALLIKPYSVKLLKAYAIESARIGFENEALHALQELRLRLSDQAFKKFIAENPSVFAMP